MRCMKRIILLCLAILLVVGMTGCRKSDLLTQIAYDQRQQESDPDTQVAENDKDNEEEDDSLPKEKESDRQNRVETNRIASTKGTGTTAGAASSKLTSGKSDSKDPKDSDQNKKDDAASDQKGADDGKNKKSAEESRDKEKDQDKSDQTDQNNDSRNETPSDDEKGSGTDGKKTDDPGNPEGYDDNGEEVDLPENVSRVVASGDAAIMVQMLGGNAVLAGTSASVSSNALAQAVFADEGIGDAAVYWDGDGGSPMGDQAFSSLLSDKPDVCVTISGQESFSASQVKKLKQEGIAYVVLPKFNTLSNIEEAASQVGVMIGDRRDVDGGMDAEALAGEYVDYCNSMVKSVKKKCGLFTFDNTDMNNDYTQNGKKTAKGAKSSGLYSLYIKDWDPSAKLTLSIGKKAVYKETGIAVAENGYSNAPVSYMMSIAGVLNNAARLSESKCRTYAVIPFNINSAAASLSGSAASIYSPYNESFVRFWASGYGDNNVALRSGVCLGEDKFPAVIVDSWDTRNRLYDSQMWWYYEPVAVDEGKDNGLLTDAGFIPSYIRSSDYAVYVNPYGISSWADGSAESILESIWVGYQISGKYSKSEVEDAVRTFYRKFYRHDLSANELEYILAGQ